MLLTDVVLMRLDAARSDIRSMAIAGYDPEEIAEMYDVSVSMLKSWARLRKVKLK